VIDLLDNPNKRGKPIHPSTFARFLAIVPGPPITDCTDVSGTATDAATEATRAQKTTAENSTSPRLSPSPETSSQDAYAVGRLVENDAV
jgi:hypothetical protein